MAWLCFIGETVEEYDIMYWDLLGFSIFMYNDLLEFKKRFAGHPVTLCAEMYFDLVFLCTGIYWTLKKIAGHTD